MSTGRRGGIRAGRRGAREVAGALLGVALAAFGGAPAGAGESLSLTLPEEGSGPRALPLEESLRLAAERNLRLRSARHEAAEFAEEVPKAYKEFFPKLRGQARYYLQSPRPLFINPAGSTPVPPSPAFPSGLLLPSQDVPIVAGQRTDYGLHLRLEQPLFAGHRLTSAYAAAQLDQQMAGARLVRAQHEVAEQVKVAYFEALKAEELRQAAEARVRLQEAEIRHTEGLVAGGRATANELPPLRAALAAARQEAFEASQRAEVALQDLKRLAGLDPAEAVRLAHPPEERVLALEAAEAARMAQDQRPELRELALMSDRAREGITQARSGYYPRIGLFGTYDKARQTILNPRGDFVAGGIEATWTLWEWGRTQHEVAQAELRHERALADLRDRRAGIGQEARASFAEVRVAERRATTLREAVEAARTAAAVAEERLRGGAAVVRDVTVARSELTGARARYRAAVYDGYVARARLERILGVPDLPTTPGGPPLAMDLPADLGAPEPASVRPAEATPVALPSLAPARDRPAPPPTPVKADAGPPPPEPAPGLPAAATLTPSGPAPPPPAAIHWLDEPAVVATPGGYRIAVAALEDRRAAEDLGRGLAAHGFGPLEVRAGSKDEVGRFRVVLVGFRAPQTAQRAARDARRTFPSAAIPPTPGGITAGAPRAAKPAGALEEPPPAPPPAASLPRGEAPEPAGRDQAAADAGAPGDPAPARFALRIASFQDAARASTLARALGAQGFREAVVIPATLPSGQWHRVILTGFPTREAARRAARAVQARFATSPVLIEPPREDSAPAP